MTTNIEKFNKDLTNNVLTLLTPEQEKELSSIIQNEPKESEKWLKARNILINANLRLINFCASKRKNTLCRFGIVYDDLIEWGMIGLIDAASSYDSKRSKFSVWAINIIYWRYQNMILERNIVHIPHSTKLYEKKIREAEMKYGRPLTEDEIQKEFKVSIGLAKNLLKGHYTISFEDLSPNIREQYLGVIDNSFEEENQSRSLKECIFKQMQKLTPKQQRVLKEYYFNHKTYQEIATELGITKQTVHRVVKRAEVSLKNKLLMDPVFQTVERENRGRRNKK